MEDREKWHNIYNFELFDMFTDVINIIESNYPKAEIDIENSFHNFSRLVYHCSSKQLSEYTKASEYNN